MANVFLPNIRKYATLFNCKGGRNIPPLTFYNSIVFWRINIFDIFALIEPCTGRFFAL